MLAGGWALRAVCAQPDLGASSRGVCWPRFDSRRRLRFSLNAAHGMLASLGTPSRTSVPVRTRLFHKGSAKTLIIFWEESIVCTGRNCRLLDTTLRFANLDVLWHF